MYIYPPVKGSKTHKYIALFNQSQFIIAAIFIYFTNIDKHAFIMHTSII